MTAITVTTKKPTGNAARVRSRLLAAFLLVTAVPYVGAEALDPRGTDQVVTSAAVAFKVLPIAAAHSSQLYLSGSLSVLALGGLAVSYAAIAALVTGRGWGIATIAALLGGLATLTRFIPRRRWAEVFPVTPATLLAWHRKLAASKYDTSTRRRPGRPATIRSIARLTVRLAHENPLWGYRHIHGELTKLGVTVAASTVYEILRAEGARRRAVDHHLHPGNRRPRSSQRGRMSNSGLGIRACPEATAGRLGQQPSKPGRAGGAELSPTQAQFLGADLSLPQFGSRRLSPRSCPQAVAWRPATLLSGQRTRPTNPSHGAPAQERGRTLGHGPAASRVARGQGADCTPVTAQRKPAHPRTCIRPAQHG